MINYKRVLILLKHEYGWDLTNSLTDTGKKLVMDTLKANNIIENNPEAYKEAHRDGSIAVIEKPKFPPNREIKYNILKGAVKWWREQVAFNKWAKYSDTVNELNKTDREWIERIEAYVESNNGHNELLRDKDKDKIIESLEREVKKLNAIIKENL